MVVLYGVRRTLAGVIDPKPSFARAARRPGLQPPLEDVYGGNKGLLCASGDLYSSYGETMEN